MFDNLKDKEVKEGGVTTVTNTSSPFEPAANQTVPVAANSAVKAALGLEDIFSGSEGAAKPPAFQPKADIVPDPYVGYNTAKEPKVLINKLFILATMVMGLALLGGGVYWSYNNFFGSAETPVDAEEANNLAEEQVIPAEIIDNEAKEAEAEPETIEAENAVNTPADSRPTINSALIAQATSTKDTDQDGLTDQEEVEFGTNANSTDTDGDGLFDREEARVYKTDPLNPDTDGDSFSDGAEVKAGYNPNGEGKLFNL